MTIKLLTEQHLEFLSLKGVCTGWSESTLVKMPHCEPQHEISNNVVCATIKASDQLAHTRSLIRAFAICLDILTIKLLTEQHLEFLSLIGDCIGSSESTLVKMPHCWKSHVTAHAYPLYISGVFISKSDVGVGTIVGSAVFLTLAAINTRFLYHFRCIYL